MDVFRDITLKYGVSDYRNFRFFIISNLNWVRYEQLVQFLAQFIPQHTKVLELGCGCAHTTAMLASMRKDLKIIGTDIEPAETWNHFKKFGCLFIECNALELPFNSEEFDTIVSFGVLEHVEDQQRFLKEINRCLKKGGHNIIFNLPNRYSLSELICKKLGITHHEKIFKVSEIKNLLSINGFKIIDFEKEHFIPAQIDRISCTLGNIFNKIYKLLFMFDKLICKTSLSLFCQDIRIISQKSP